MTLRRGGRESQMSLLRATGGRTFVSSKSSWTRTDRVDVRWSSSPLWSNGAPPPLAASSPPPTAPLGRSGPWHPPDPPGHRSHPCAQQNWSEPAIRKRIIRIIILKCFFGFYFNRYPLYLSHLITKKRRKLKSLRKRLCQNILQPIELDF